MQTYITEYISYLIPFAIIIICYVMIRNFFKRIADYTESRGEIANHLEELKDEVERLNKTIQSLEQQLKNK